GKRTLAREIEDAKTLVTVVRHKKDEYRHEKVHILRDRLHRALWDTAGVAKYRELVPAELLVAEHVEQRVLVARHRRSTALRTSSRKASNTGSLSRGPGAPSGWY